MKNPEGIMEFEKVDFKDAKAVIEAPLQQNVLAPEEEQEKENTRQAELDEKYLIKNTTREPNPDEKARMKAIIERIKLKPEAKLADDSSHKFNAETGKLNHNYKDPDVVTKRNRNKLVNTFIADERNKEIPWYKKIFNKDKVSSIDIAREEALKINAKVDKDQEMNAVFDISKSNTEVSFEKTKEVQKEVMEELEKFRVNLDSLKENDYKFSKEVLTKEKEPAINSLREKLGRSMSGMFAGLASLDKEKILMTSAIVAIVSAMIPVMGISDLQTVISILPDSVSHLLKSPELAGSPIWSIVTPGGESFSMPSMENYNHQVDVFKGVTDIPAVTGTESNPFGTPAITGTESNPFGTPVDVSDTELKMDLDYNQKMKRLASAFGNMGSAVVIVPSLMLAGKTFGKIGKYFIDKK